MVNKHMSRITENTIILTSLQVEKIIVCLSQLIIVSLSQLTGSSHIMYKNEKHSARRIYLHLIKLRRAQRENVFAICYLTPRDFRIIKYEIEHYHKKLTKITDANTRTTA